MSKKSTPQTKAEQEVARKLFRIKQRRYYKENRERMLEYNREYQRRYREKHKKALTKYRKEYWQTHKEERLAYNRRYQQMKASGQWKPKYHPRGT